jgi:hypothetical protein
MRRTTSWAVNIAAIGRHLDMQIRKPCNYGYVDRKRTIFPA